ncbi:MAG: DUF3810 domain-containing protein [Prolixibacteraceae bacterium]|jgi:hypothetical protein|nr:DUF3810 domain-containing protein [Prolixibacteraceae bacterium]
MVKKIGKLLFQKSLLLSWAAVFTFVLSRLLAAFPTLTEQLYSQGLYPFLAAVLSSFSRHIPFSVGDVFYAFLLMSFLILVFSVVMKKTGLKEACMLLVNSLSVCFVLFYWLWGFNYFRKDFNARFGIPGASPDKMELLTALGELVNATNTSYLPVYSIDRLAVDSIIENSYQKHAGELKISYPSGSRYPKHITCGSFFAKAMISGYYGPFFSEVHVNRLVLPIEYPMVLAHEKAHQFGITSEAEASFFAWFVCTQSGDRQAAYSANLYILRYFINEASRLEETREIVNNLKKEVRQDYAKIRDHWMALRNEKIDEVAGKVNDAYLKANKVERGIEDYSGVVKLVMDHREVKKETDLPRK